MTVGAPDMPYVLSPGTLLRWSVATYVRHDLHDFDARLEADAREVALVVCHGHTADARLDPLGNMYLVVCRGTLGYALVVPGDVAGT